MKVLKFDINNNGSMILWQNNSDGDVFVETYDNPNGDGKRHRRDLFKISPGDFVMLMNYYRAQKESGKPIF